MSGAVRSRCRFIQKQQQFGIERERTADLEKALLAIRQIASLFVGK